MSIDWKTIRPLSGSQANGFEEFCSQLARTECPPEAVYHRKGTPDGGVECFCVFPDDSEWGWQAKYFDTLGDSQWAQLDESVKSALNKHPALVRYIVCVPLDRPDARIDNRMSAMERWNARTKKWEGWAKDKGMSVEFVWWGSSELLHQLADSRHAGRIYFWFGEHVFDDAWFQARLKASLEAAGPRYTPEVHIDLPIARSIDMFGRTRRAVDRIKSMAKDLRKELQYLTGYRYGKEKDPTDVVDTENLVRTVEDVLNALSALAPAPVGKLPFSEIAAKAESAKSAANSVMDDLSQLEEEHDAQKRDDDDRSDYRENPFRRRLHHIYRIQYQLRELRSELSDANEIGNNNLLLLKGDAGVGKTHLLCDVASARVSDSAPTVLLMGQRFLSREEPWTQTMQQLDLPGVSGEDFVGALEAAAQAADCRALLIIDGINEGQGRLIWPSHLAAFLATVEQSSWIGVLISVRSTYEEVVIPENISARAASAYHNGFADHEYDATLSYFSYYGLELPSTPILQPEFRNPLFLKTICQGLRDQGERRLPRGFHGISAALELYLVSINKRLARTLGFNPKDNFVKKALERIAEVLVNIDERWLPRTRAQELVNDLLPAADFEYSLYRELVAEGVLIEEMAWVGGDDREEVAYISFDRFADHAIADLLLRSHLDSENPAAAFAESGGLAFLCDPKKYVSSGLVEALCIQVPERVGEELIRLAPSLIDSPEIRSAFRKSIVWRKPDAFSDSTREVLSESSRSEYELDESLDVLVTVATIEGHPFNAEFLDRRLRRDAMADRDSWWSTYLHRSWRTGSATDRLVDWASGVSPDDDLDISVVELASKTLSWMFATPNRYLRDRSTKALVSLLSGRLDCAARIVEWVSDIDDSYVVERVYAAAYGLVMRSTDLPMVERIAASLYEEVFSNGAPPAHILLRDYARGVIERAIYLGSGLDLDVNLIRPPYTSEWPEIPDEKQIAPLMPDWTRGSYDSGESDWSHNRIGSSVMDDDFARYVIGTNSWSTNWLSLRIDEQPWRSSEERMTELLPSLTDSGRAAWDTYKTAASNVGQVRMYIRMQSALASPRPADEGDQSYSDSDDESAELELELKNATKTMDDALEKLRDALDDKHVAEVNEIVEARNIDGPERPPRFDLKLIQRYVLWRVFDLGWTIERFGQFDRYSVSMNYRSAAKAERIGKKYQWIAFHEILAYVSDNFQYIERYGDDDPDREYLGTWQEYLRDIDPSCTLQSTPGGTSWDGHTQSWWGDLNYGAWDEGADHSTWLARTDDFPDPSKLIVVNDPRDDSRWINTHGYYDWRQDHPADVESTDVDRRDIWLILNAYFMRADDAEPFIKWAKEVNFTGRWMPDPSELSRMYLGEYGWSPAFRYLNRPYYGGISWVTPENECPVSVRLGTSEYSAETSGFDCSIDEGFTLRLPDHELIQKLGLIWTGQGADFCDSEGELIAFDPTAHEPGPSAILIRENSLIEFLDSEGLALCWTVLGEKQVYGKGFGGSQYHGYLTASGAYMLDGPEITGFLNFHHERPK